MRAAAAARRALERRAHGREARRVASSWLAYSRLMVVGDGAGWSLDRDAEHLQATARRLGLVTAPASWAAHVERQVVFLTSHFTAVRPGWLASSHRLATAWFHGLPGTPGYPEFDTSFATLRAHRERFSRLQVTHAAMRDAVLEAGVPPERVHTIPIGIDLPAFPCVTSEMRAAARVRLGVPADGFVVGSFQKDGDGWGEGLAPKLVKGPDVLADALTAAARAVDGLHVLLTGPARGYVKARLTESGVPFTYAQLGSEGELAGAYHALDAYLVPSRQEGGPKGALESLACGIPLVTTRVGQAAELVRDGENGLLVPVGDADALFGGLVRLADDPALRARLAAEGRRTAEGFDHPLLDSAWRDFFAGVVE